jgi:hypothetical protein
MAGDWTGERSNVEWLRAQAARFSALADKAILPEIKTRLLEIAREYEALAAKAEAPRANIPAMGNR